MQNQQMPPAPVSPDQAQLPPDEVPMNSPDGGSPEQVGQDFAWEEQATPEEQAEYERVMNAISKVVYSDDKSFAGIEKMLQGPDPVDSLVRATVTLITEIDKKVNIPEVVLPQLPFTVFDMLLEIGTKAGFFDLSDQEVKTGLGAALDTTNRVYGITEDDFNAMSQGLTEQDVEELGGAYQEVTNGKGFVSKSS